MAASPVTHKKSRVFQTVTQQFNRKCERNSITFRRVGPDKQGFRAELKRVESPDVWGRKETQGPISEVNSWDLGEVNDW